MAVVVDLIGELLDVGGEPGLQRRGQHLAGAIADNRIQQRPTRTRVVVGSIRVVSYREQGCRFPPARQRRS